MTSNNDAAETDVKIKIQKTLFSINDITLKIMKEQEMINELVKENGHLHTEISAANLTLSKKAHEMGIKNIEQIITQNKQRKGLQLDLGSITSAIVIEKLSKYMDDEGM